MTRKYCELNRQFFEQSTHKTNELSSRDYKGKRVGWKALLENSVSVIVAPANFGKTTEMMQKAEGLRAEGLEAVFLPLRMLVDARDVEEALDKESLNSYRRWKSSKTSELTLFVDSLDEAAAVKNQQIDILLKRVLLELGDEYDRVKWVISTRPAILTDDVLKRISSILDFPLATKQRSESATPTFDEILEDEASETNIVSDTKEFKIFKMAPLDSHQGVIYLKGTRPTIDATRLINLALERGLSGFCRNPGGLDILARIDLLNSPPYSLTEIFQRIANQLAEKIASDDRFADSGHPSQKLLIDVLERIASATQVCRKLNIQLPEANSDPDESFLSARRIANADVSELALRQLLSSQSFIDAGFNQVKIYPDELAPFLAARRLAKLVDSAEKAVRLINVFSWTSPTGEKGVHKEYFLMLGWLATLNPHCRALLIELDPQVLAFFGDLRNSDVPKQDVQKALRESIKRLVEQGDSPGRGLYYLTSENYWAAAPERLYGEILSLYQEYRWHSEAKSLLLHMAEASKIELIRKPLLSAHGDDYRGVLDDRDEVRYLLSLGRADDAEGLAEALKSTEEITDTMVFAVLPYLGWTYFTPYDITKIIRRLTSEGQSYFGLSFFLESEDLLKRATEQQRYQLARGQIIHLLKPNRPFAGDEYRDLRNSDDYRSVTETILREMVRGATKETRNAVCRLCLVVQNAIYGELHQLDVKEIRVAFAENQYIRREYLRELTKQSKLKGLSKWSLLQGSIGIALFDDEDRKAVLSKSELKAFGKWSDQHQSEMARVIASGRTPKIKPLIKMSDEAQSQIRTRRKSLRSGKNSHTLIWISRWMMKGASLQKYGDVDFTNLENAVGISVAADVLEGMGRVWRERDTRFDSDNPNTTYYITIVGLQGLCIEISRGMELEKLPPSEVVQALRYAKFEMNNYPKWFWLLVEAHPKIATEELKSVAEGHAAGASEKAHAERLFSKLADAPAFIQDALFPEVWAYIKNDSGHFIAERVLPLLTNVSHRPAPAEYEKIVWEKLKNVSLPENLADGLNGVQEDAITWASQWLMLFPKEFHAAMMKLGKRDANLAMKLLGRVTAYFGHNFGASLSKVAAEGVEGIRALEFMRTVAKWAVPAADDVVRVSGRVYSPGPRDHAERARDKILDVLASRNTQAAYSALDNLSKKAEGAELRYIRKLMFEMREREHYRDPVSQSAYANFELTLKPTITASVAFSMAVHADLEAVKYDIEKGEHSLRCFFSEVDFARISKDDEEGTKAALALEEHFQILLASEMRHQARGRYTVGLEVQTAEKKRRDIECSVEEWRASIEIKMSERWTLQDYVVALEDQLVKQYMRNRNANTGFLVIVLQKNRRWNALKGKGKLDFDGVIKFLQQRALEIFELNPQYYLRVIGIDAVAPADFRKS